MTEECEKRYTIRIPCVLYNKLVKMGKERGYKTLSELIRDIIRDAVERYESSAKSDGELAVGVVA